MVTARNHSGAAEDNRNTVTRLLAVGPRRGWVAVPIVIVIEFCRWLYGLQNSAGGCRLYKILQVAIGVIEFCRWLYVLHNSAGGYLCYKILQVAIRVTEFCRWLYVLQNSAGGYTCYRILQVAIRVTEFCRWLFVLQNSAGGYLCCRILQVAICVTESAGGYLCYKILQVAMCVTEFCTWLCVLQISAGSYTSYRILQTAVRYICMAHTQSVCIRQFTHEPSLIIFIVTSVRLVFFANSPFSFWFRNDLPFTEGDIAPGRAKCRSTVVSEFFEAWCLESIRTTLREN
jgi:hypothetical protein